MHAIQTEILKESCPTIEIIQVDEKGIIDKKKDLLKTLIPSQSG